MKILLSPAKSFIQNQPQFSFEMTEPIFYEQSMKLASKMKSFSVNRFMTIMRISKDLAQLNVDRMQHWSINNVGKNRMFPAGLGFMGEVYKGLDFDSLKIESKIAAQNNLRFLSGMYGLLKPFDAIQPYRLEMGTKWEIDSKTKNLYQFWSEKVTQALNDELNENETIVNLASTEYFKVVNRKKIKNRIITPVFKEFKNGKFQIVMMYAKNARGKMARWIIENDIQDFNHIKEYQQDHYKFDPKLSSEHEWVYVR